ncbi:hypothetical protein B0H19DRAFT_384238 [Mycena capillaripes]|nr:hypothetical protein B0H19DRAFT_384238 [Mycena capillaripes]
MLGDSRQVWLLGQSLVHDDGWSLWRYQVRRDARPCAWQMVVSTYTRISSPSRWTTQRALWLHRRLTTWLRSGCARTIAATPASRWHRRIAGRWCETDVRQCRVCPVVASPGVGRGSFMRECREALRLRRRLRFPDGLRGSGCTSNPSNSRALVAPVYNRSTVDDALAMSRLSSRRRPGNGKCVLIRISLLKIISLFLPAWGLLADSCLAALLLVSCGNTPCCPSLPAFSFHFSFYLPR